MKNMPWFRMYTDAVDDEKLRLIAPSDRWYFFAILCCKGKGILDEGGALLKRKVAVKLGLQVDELEEVARRLAEVALIDRETLQPLGWEGRQFKSDGDPTGAERKRRQRERARAAGGSNAVERTGEEGHGHVTRDGHGQFTTGHGHVTRTDTDTEEEKDKKQAHTRKRGADVSDPADEKPLNAKALVAEGVERQHAVDWLALRKAKRLPLTPTAWEAVRDEAGKCGMTPAQAVEHAVKSNWAGFKAKWVVESDSLDRKHGGAWWLSDETALAMAGKVGVGRAYPTESRDAWHARIRAAIDNGGVPPVPPSQQQSLSTLPAVLPPVVAEAAKQAIPADARAALLDIARRSSVSRQLVGNAT